MWYREGVLRSRSAIHSRGFRWGIGGKEKRSGLGLPKPLVEGLHLGSGNQIILVDDRDVLDAGRRYLWHPLPDQPLYARALMGRHIPCIDD